MRSTSEKSTNVMGEHTIQARGSLRSRHEVASLTPKLTRKPEALSRVPPTIALCLEEDSSMRKWPLPRYCCASCILETKTKVGNTTAKAPSHVPTQISMSRPLNPNHTPTHHTNALDERVIQMRWPPHRHPSRHSKPTPSSGSLRPLSHVVKKTLRCLL